jgi:hypothetical protein
MGYRLRTLLIVVSCAALFCGNWVAVFDALRTGRLNLAQLHVLVAAWSIAMPALHWPGVRLVFCVRRISFRRHRHP